MEAKFSVQVELLNTSLLRIGGLKPCTTISAVKKRVEQQAGILPHTYRLTYLDAAPLDDCRTLGELDVVSGATLKAAAWRMWREVVAAALRGDVRSCLEELRAIGERGERQWRDHCGWCTLYTAAHRGHYVLLCDLLKEWPTVSVNAQSPCGWTALHAAARTGRWKALCVLVDHGADVRITDKRGLTAADVAHSSGHRKCEHSLRFCEWNIKKYGIVHQRAQDYDAGKERTAAARRAHQYADSTYTIWLSGPRGTEYMVHTPNPVSVKEVDEFRTKQTKSSERQQSVTALVELPSLNTSKPPGEGMPKPEDRASERARFNYGWFDKERAQQLVPTTYQILTYSDLSPSHPQPHPLINQGSPPLDSKST